MAGAGLTALERFQHSIKEETEVIRNSDPLTCAADPEAANARACAVARIELAVHHAQRNVTRRKSRAVLATELSELGKALASLGEFEAAIQVGFQPSVAVSQRWRDRVEANLCAAQAWAQYLQKGFAFGRASLKLPLARRGHVCDVALEALGLVREAHQEIKAHPKHEAEYWLTHNAAQLCAAICEPMITLGFADAIRSHILFSILAVEDQLPLCATKFLGLRERLYSVAWSTYESLGALKAAKNVAQRLGAQVSQLRADEMQDAPVPDEVLSALDHAHLLAQIASAKFDLLGIEDGADADERAARIIRDALAIDVDAAEDVWLEGPTAVQRLESLAEILSIVGARPLRAHVTAVRDATKNDFGGLAHAMPRLERAVAICVEKVRSDAGIRVDAGADDAAEEDAHQESASKTSSDESENEAPREPQVVTPGAQLPVQACVKLVASFLQFACWPSAMRLLKCLATPDLCCVEDPAQRAKIEILRTIALTSVQLRGDGEIDSETLLLELGFDKDHDAVLMSGEMAEVEGRLIYVNTIRVLASTLRRHADLLHLVEPDLLTDAALLLWSPFCTAMLDTVASCSPEDPLNPTLIEVTTEVLDCAYYVVLVSDMEDALLRAMIALRYASFLHTRDVEDSRAALQVLRRGLQSLDVQRGELCTASGKASLTANEKALRGEHASGALASLASVHCDMLCLLFEIELDLAHQEEGAAAHQPTAASKVKAAEQRLAAEFRHNKYARALLGATTLSRREPDAFAEKAKTLATVNKLLAEAGAQESALLAQASNDDADCAAAAPSEVEEKATEAAKLSLVPTLRILARSASSITVEVRPSRTARPGAPHHYAIFGKPAGSGTEVSITNTGLVNTGVPHTPDSKDASKPFSISVSDLAPNESYVFAVAAFDEDGQVLGGGISSTSMEVQTLCPLPLLECYGAVASLAFASIRTIVTGPPREYQALHKSIKEHVCSCKRACQTACSFVIRAFVAFETPGPLWERLPSDDFWLIRDEILAAPQPGLQAFAKATLILHKLERNARPLFPSPPTNVALVRFDVKRSVVGASAEICRQVQSLSLALHAACGLHDSTLILQLASAIYHDLQGLFELQRPLNGVLRILIAVQFALRQIPRSMWTNQVSAMYAYCSYQILRFTTSGREGDLAKTALLSGSAGLLGDDEGAESGHDDVAELHTDARDEDLPSEATLAQRTLRETHQEQHALAVKMRFELAGLFGGPALKSLEKIHSAVRNGHAFAEASGPGALEDKEHDAVPLPDPADGDIEQKLGVDEEVLVCLSRARAAEAPETRGALISRAWEILSLPGAEESPDYLQLMTMVCKTSLDVGGGVETARWADEAQHVLWDLDSQSEAHARPFVLDVMWEEQAENVEPMEAVAALAAPLSEDDDPLGLDEIDNLRAQIEELQEFIESISTNATSSPRTDAGSQADGQESQETKEEVHPDANANAEDGGGNDDEERESQRVDAIAKAKLEIDGLKARLDILERRARLIAAGNGDPSAEVGLDAKKQLIMLADFERIRAFCLYRKWLAVDWSVLHASDSQLDYNDPAAGRLVEGMLDEGPRTDLRWLPMKDPMSAEVHPSVPRLRPLPNSLAEGDELGEEEDERESIDEGGEPKGGAQDGLAAAQSGVGGDAETLKSAQDAALAAFKDAFANTPQLLHFLARAMTRAKWAEAWQQLENIGKLLWNVLEFAWVTPTQFTEDAVCEAALVPALRTKLQVAREEEARSRAAAREAEEAADPSATASVETTSGRESGDAGIPAAPQVEAGCYDWRPVFRAGVAVVEMLEKCRTPSRRGAKRKALRDVWWASRLVGFTLQVLCHLKRWPQLVVLGKRFVVAVDKTDALVSQALPLIVLAQTHLVQTAKAEVARVEAALNDRVASWEEAQKKKKRRKAGRRVRSNSVDGNMSDAEQSFLDEKAALEGALAVCVSRLEKLEAMEAEVVKMQANLTRDKSTCEEALETAQALAKRALLEFLTPDSHGLALLAPVPGLSTRRSRTQRTQRSARSVISKSSRISRKSRLNDGASVLSKFTNDHEVDMDAELGMSGASVKDAIQAYTKAVQMMRQKQETNLLAQALLEMGDLQAAQGGIVGWKAACVAWTDAVDAILQQVDSVNSWQVILEEAVESFPPTVSRWSARENFATSAELTACQSILGKFGARGCLLAALGCAKLAQHTLTGNLNDASRNVRLAGWLFASLFGTSMGHPTRACDYALYRTREIMPGLDQALLNNRAVRKSDVLSALAHVARELSHSERQADNLLALPIASLYECVGRAWSLSSRAVLESYLIRAEALTRLGLVRESGLAIREVLLGADLPIGEEGILRASADLQLAAAGATDDAQESVGDVLAQLQQRFATQRGLFALSSTHAPWSPENRAALAALVDPGPDAEPVMWIANMLGPELMRTYKLCRLGLFCRVLAFWSPSQSVQNEGDDADETLTRDQLSQRALELLHPQLPAVVESDIAAAQEEGEGAEGDDAPPQDPMALIAQNATTAVQARVAELLVAGGKLRAAIRWASVCLKTPEGEPADTTQAGSNADIRCWLRLRFSLLRSAELMGAAESVAAICEVIESECKASAEGDLFREARLRRAEALARLGNVEDAARLAEDVTMLSSTVQDLTFVKAVIVSHQTREAWRRCENQKGQNLLDPEGDDASAGVAAIETALVAARIGMGAVGFFEPRQATPMSRRTLYTDLLAAYGFVALLHGEIFDSKDSLEESLRVTGVSLVPLAWIEAKARLLDASEGSKSPAGEESLKACAELACRAQGLTLDLGRQACTRLGLTAVHGTRQWLRAAVRFGGALASLGADLSEFARKVEASDDTAQREAGLGAYFHDQLAGDVGAQGLLSRLQRELFARSVGLDLDRYERIRALYGYLRASVDGFEATFVVDPEVLPRHEDAGPEVEGEESAEESTALQWLRDGLRKGGDVDLVLLQPGSFTPIRKTLAVADAQRIRDDLSHAARVRDVVLMGEIAQRAARLLGADSALLFAEESTEFADAEAGAEVLASLEPLFDLRAGAFLGNVDERLRSLLASISA